MNLAPIYVKMALQYKKRYEECSWWKFKKRNNLYKSWQHCLNLIIKHSK